MHHEILVKFLLITDDDTNIQTTDVKNLPIMNESFRGINHQKMEDMNHPIVDGLVVV